MECFLLFKNYIGGVEMALTLHNGDLNKLARDTSQDSINFMVGGQKDYNFGKHWRYLC